MAYLADDLIGDILLRLPVKSLLRFKCVSKTWFSLIDNNSFVKQHLNSSIDKKTNNGRHKLVYGFRFDLFSVSLYSLTDQPLELVPPIKSTNINVFGSCNGLLCLSYGVYSNLVLLWNPATKKHVKLPVVRRHRRLVGSDYPFDYGFGYDSVCDDYKVVMVREHIPNYCASETNVYSLRSNSWRTIGDVLRYPIRGPSVLACGALHWIGKSTEFCSRLVAAFDLATEKYRVVTLPKYHVDLKHYVDLVSELGGCLSIVCDHYKVDVIDVWVMKDYGVTESWTKLFTISRTKVDRTPIHLAYSEIGDEVLLMGPVFWYNLEIKTIKFVDVCGFFNSFRPMTFMESLVCLGEKAQHDERLNRKKVHEEEAYKMEPVEEAAVFPCVLRICNSSCYNKNNLIDLRVEVVHGTAKVGTPICIPSKNFIDIGRIKSIRDYYKLVDSAAKGCNVTIRINDANAEEQQKMFGKDFNEEDELVSRISMESIDSLKANYRDAVTMDEWRLLVKLKTIFKIQ